MSDTPQENRPLQIAIDGVPDAGVLVTALNGTETLSRLFRYTCELAVPVQSPLTFPGVLGKPVVVSIHQGGEEWRQITGVITRMTESRRDERFAEYTAELVPQLWLMTRNRRCRIFQHKTTQEIIKEVVGPLYDLGSAFKLEGTYHPRNICAQYHESDFAFFSRLLEEEGWYYYFTHTDGGHGIVIGDNPRGHIPIPGGGTLKYQDVGGNATAEGRVTRWIKAQTLRTTTFSLTDHSFEMPPNQLEAVELLPGTVTAGSVTHEIGWKGSSEYAISQDPGGYVRWRDGVGPGGADRPDDLQHVFDDNARLAKVRAEEELAGAVEITAVSTFNQVTPGHTFTLEDHFDADGEYLVTSVKHQATCGAATSGAASFDYANTFTCIPAGVPFRPPQETPRPVIRGTQTAVVVGSDGAEIDPDKYGRVKVWFRWDPAGQRGLDSSCWVRVAQFWAGKQWGAQFIPRVGDEVVVSFLNGSPDDPLIIGSVYNADNMPIYKLPDNKTQSGIKTHSSTGGDSQTFNEIKFEDKKGGELVSIHAEKDMSVTVEDNYTVSIGAEQKDPKKAGKSSSTTFGDTTYSVTKGDFKHSIDTGKANYFVKGPIEEVYDATQKTLVTTSIDINTKSDYIHVESPKEIKLTVGGSTITMTPDTIKIVSPNILFEAGTKIVGKAPLVEWEGTSDFKAHAPAVDVDGESTAKFQSSGGKVDVVAATKATMAVSGQAVECSPAKVAVAGAMIDVAAQGITKIAGATVMIN